MFAALKRLNIYQKEMYPIISRLLLGYLVFGEIYFIILLNHGIIDVKFGIQELVCGFTVFSFLFWLRIADDFKDYELDFEPANILRGQLPENTHLLQQKDQELGGNQLDDDDYLHFDYQ